MEKHKVGVGGIVYIPLESGRGEEKTNIGAVQIGSFISIQKMCRRRYEAEEIRIKKKTERYDIIFLGKINVI